MWVTQCLQGDSLLIHLLVYLGNTSQLLEFARHFSKCQLLYIQGVWNHGPLGHLQRRLVHLFYCRGSLESFWDFGTQSCLFSSLFPFSVVFKWISRHSAYLWSTPWDCHAALSVTIQSDTMKLDLGPDWCYNSFLWPLCYIKVTLSPFWRPQDMDWHDLSIWLSSSWQTNMQIWLRVWKVTHSFPGVQDIWAKLIVLWFEFKREI